MNSTRTNSSIIIITPTEAKAQGLKKYFTGKTCKHGHVAERYVNIGTCCECNLLVSRKYKRKVRATPEGREKHNASSLAWSAANPEADRAKEATRRARKAATAVPLTAWEKTEVKWKFKLKPKGWHLDHIRAVSQGGSDHPDNLRAIPASVNLRKGDRWDESDPQDVRSLLAALSLHLSEAGFAVLLDSCVTSPHAPPWLAAYRPSIQAPSPP